MPTNRASARSFSEPEPSWTTPTYRIAPTGSSATIEVLIERTRVWLTARLAALAYVVRLRTQVLGVLPHLVEDHHGVVEREAEDRQDAGDRRRCHLEPGQGVDADGDQDVVRQRHDRGDGHLPLAEVGPDEQHHQDEEHQQADEGALRGCRAPARPDVLCGEVVLGGPGLGQDRVGDLLALGRGQRLGLHQHRLAAGGGDHRLLGVLDAGAGDRLAELVGGVLGDLVGGQGDAVLGAALELDAEVEAA